MDIMDSIGSQSGGAAALNQELLLSPINQFTLQQNSAISGSGAAGLIQNANDMNSMISGSGAA